MATNERYARRLSTNTMSNLQTSENFIARRLASYLRLPFATDTIPGSYAEKVVADHYCGEVLQTYDFVDVVSQEQQIGWQVKCTRAVTTVTWKRVKIVDSAELIRDSDKGNQGAVQKLGDLVLETCNRHAQESMQQYNLNELRYARVIINGGRVTYFERLLLDSKEDTLFDPSHFVWTWSSMKHSSQKQQLPALHGTYNGKKWFAWHGRGENQLHFSGEKEWWPTETDQTCTIAIPTGKSKTWDELFQWLDCS